MKYDIDYDNIPEHIAIIMDGNGRWAQEKLLPRSIGHKEGSKTLKKIVNDCNNEGVKYLTVYAFSTENWERPPEEVEYLINLLRTSIKEYIDKLKESDIKISIIGDISKFDEDLQKQITYLEEESKNKEGMNLIIALNYGGRDEIIRSIKKMYKEIIKGTIDIDDINEENFYKYLDTFKIPEPSLLIRTSGEQRLSNFLSWQTAYTEFYFIDKFWPDFNVDDLRKAIYTFQNRTRRFGKV